MNKLLIILLSFLLVGCASYQPVIDSAGKSGTFTEDKANQITDDIILCEQLAEKHTNDLVESYKVVHNWYLRPSTLWLMPKAEYTNQKLVKNCLTNRGHSVLN